MKMNKKHVVAPVIGIALGLSNSIVNLKAEDVLLSSENGYELKIRTASDGQSSVGVLTHNGKTLETSEDMFALIKYIPNETSKKMRQVLILREIEKNGGVLAYQKDIDKTLIKFGPSFFNYLDANTKEAYKLAGITFTRAEAPNVYTSPTNAKKKTEPTNYKKETRENNNNKKSNHSMEW